MRAVAVLVLVLGACEARVPVWQTCDEVGLAICTRAMECDLLPVGGTRRCSVEFTNQCCEGDPAQYCNSATAASEDAVADCVAAAKVASCEVLASNNIPPECHGIGLPE